MDKVNKLDGMLMIGSTGADAGKTELTCRLIGKFGKSRPIVGMKVTTIEARDGECPRGGEGCGVCSSLEGEFAISEESDRRAGKDTSRFLSAGASSVYWLRVMRRHLKEGLEALLDIVGRDAVLVCESTSLRQVVEPGLFLMVSGGESGDWKRSAESVEGYVDRFVVAKGGEFDLNIDRIKFADGKWVIKERATAVIMAGGDSRRMGTDKSMLPIDGGTMIEHICKQVHHSFEQILISAADEKKYGFLGLETVRDRVPGHGPLMGIASALEASANDLNFVVACDIPSIDMTLVRRMLSEAGGVDVVVPKTDNGMCEPLFAVYRKSALGAINEILSSGGQRVKDVFNRCRIKYFELGLSRRLVNLNTMEEYEQFKRKYSD